MCVCAWRCTDSMETFVCEELRILFIFHWITIPTWSTPKHNSNQKVKSQRNSHQDLTCFHLHLCACASCPQLKQMTSVQKSNLSVKVTHWQLRTILKSLRQGPAFYCQCRQFHIGYGPNDLCEYPTPVLPRRKLRLALATNLPDRHDPWWRI